ncbi:disintegrin and metalloproteinase domain-containing protein 10-like [Spea bombifrons]|uniref:disintegrin and metalloproteinase domain-containing protein 10-like n=1 Tax=Spea bombifrons TaxID=233779 RepID=UPI00234B8626|nr:disintegrin and metalloproteinase domain-containing protein 10-like [Spea bombifrons]
MHSLQYFPVFLITEILIVKAEGPVVTFEKKRPFLKYYERISYDTDALLQNHQRSKRATKEEEHVLQLKLFAYERKFELVLKKDSTVFADDFEIVSNEKTVPVDVSFIYTGALTDEKQSFCHGAIIEGHFEGFIETRNGTFYVEYEKNHNNATVDSYMYHESDIDYSLMKDAESFDLALQKYQLLEKMTRKAKVESPIRTKRSLDLTLTTCLLHIKADFFFYNRFKSIEKVISQIAAFIVSVNTIYDSVNFDGIKHVNFKVKMLNVIQDKDPSGNMDSAFIGPEKLLMLHSESNWNNYCLSYLLTNRDYNGVLGLAWNGRPGNSGGVCSKFDKFQDDLQTQYSLNTGVVTIQKYGQYLPPRLIHITLAHEFGHSLGSPHDGSEECAKFPITPDNKGNYLMFPYAMDGIQYNNDKFSPCSINYISNLLHVKMDQCFVESGCPSCGNQIVEDGEQCDVGFKDNDPCCYGAKLGDPLQCTLRPGKQCSFSQGLCCNHACSYKSKGELCQDEAECTFESYCTGVSAKCPKPSPKRNYTLCNFGTRICQNGICRQSVCLKYGLEQCDCNSDAMHEKCQLCCQYPGNPYSCKNTKSVELENLFNRTLIQLPPGTACGHRKGYCDKFHICRYVDADGPIARLRKSFLNLIELEDTASWMKARWWAILLIILTLAALMAGTVFIFGRTLDTGKGNKLKKQSRKVSSLQRNQAACYEKEFVASAYVQYETRM